jgi:hypothetical protein
VIDKGLLDSMLVIDRIFSAAPTPNKILKKCSDKYQGFLKTGESTSASPMEIPTSETTISKIKHKNMTGVKRTNGPTKSSNPLLNSRRRK